MACPGICWGPSSGEEQPPWPLKFAYAGSKYNPIRVHPYTLHEPRKRAANTVVISAQVSMCFSMAPHIRSHRAPCSRAGSVYRPVERRYSHRLGVARQRARLVVGWVTVGAA